MNTTQDTEIHPEIPRAAWVTARYLDDDGHAVVDEHEYEDDMWTVSISVSHSIRGDGRVHTHPMNVFLRWDNVWPNGGGVDHETMTIFPQDIEGLIAVLQRAEAAAKRSEEHTSELQSLMRNSYDVFCLKKKNNT